MADVDNVWSTCYEYDEEPSQLRYFDTVAETVASVNETFGRTLPAQFNTWQNIDSDETLALILTAGGSHTCLAIR